MITQYKLKPSRGYASIYMHWCQYNKIRLPVCMICRASIKHSYVPIHKIWSASITYILANPHVCFVCQYIINNCLVCQYIKKICAGSPGEYFRWYCSPVHQLFLSDASTRLHCSPVHICTGMRIRIFMMDNRRLGCVMRLNTCTPSQFGSSLCWVLSSTLY